jgi:plasmid segregation protein ParM
MLIAIDHGNKQVKTVHGNAIISGVQKSKTRPYGRDVLKYSGSFYTLSAQRIPYQKDKTTDERFFILSLFAIAEEIEAQGAYTSGLMPIDLAIGLPPAHFGAQNKAFVRYFKRKEPIYFSYRDKLYSILIRNVQCYPQAFAAAAMMLGELAKATMWMKANGRFLRTPMRPLSTRKPLTMCSVSGETPDATRTALGSPIP